MLEGCFFVNPGTPQELRLPNTIVGEGAEVFLKALFRGEAVTPATYYIGLTNTIYAFDSVIADLSGDEPAGNGYARQPAVKNTSDWTVVEENGVWQARSKPVTFNASADWNIPWSRMFLCSVVSGNSGKLFAVSRNAPTPITILSGLGPQVSYRISIRG